MDVPYNRGDLLRIRPDRRDVHYVQSWGEEGGDLFGPVPFRELVGSLLVIGDCRSRGVFVRDVELAEGPW